MERKKALKIGAGSVAGVFVGLVILGNIIGPDDEAPAAETSAEATESPTPTGAATTPAPAATTAAPTPEPTTAPPAPPAPADTVGQPLPDARTTLEAAGYTVTATDSLEDRGIWAEENWVVTTQEISGTDVMLGVQKATDGAAGDAEAAPAPTTSTTTTPSGLTTGMASVACDNRAELDYVYGWDASWLWDGTSLVEGDTIFLKAGVDIENAFGNEYSATVECRVSGTEDAPVIDSFSVY